MLVCRSLCKLFAVTHRPQTEQPRARALPRHNSPEPYVRLVACAAWMNTDSVTNSPYLAVPGRYPMVTTFLHSPVVSAKRRVR